MFKLIDHIGASRQATRRAREAIYSRGDATDGYIYCVIEGEVSEVPNKTGSLEPMKTLPAHSFFGDIEVMSGAARRLKSYVAKSGSVRIALIEKSYAVKVGSIYPEFFLILLKSSIDALQSAESEWFKRQST